MKPAGRVVRDLAALRDVPLDYPVFVDRGAIDALGDVVHAFAPAHRIVVIADATVAALHRDRLLASFGGAHVDLLTVPPGEAEKTRERWAQLTDAMLALEVGRDTTVVAVGGGVVGDLAGFTAATFMRGVPVVQVPTTLLAMVDAAVGGKTAVDIPAGKNLVGAFHDPRAVLMDPALLRTLPAATMRAGLAEMIKHGVIAGREYFAAVSRALPEIAARGADCESLPELIAGSVRIKAGIVARDAREGGLRQVLNFGHTIAHAIEQLSDYGVGHGDAVAIGMVVEARIAEALGVGEPGLSAAIRQVVERAGLPAATSSLSPVPFGASERSSSTESARTAGRIVAATRGDKKVRAGSVRYALPRRIGEMEPGDGSWSVAVTDGIAESALFPDPT